MKPKLKPAPPKRNQYATFPIVQAFWMVHRSYHGLEWLCPYCQLHEQLSILATNPTHGITLRYCLKVLKHYIIKIDERPITQPPLPHLNKRHTHG
jgi:hypothetical protein